METRDFVNLINDIRHNVSHILYCRHNEVTMNTSNSVSTTFYLSEYAA